MIHRVQFTAFQWYGVHVYTKYMHVVKMVYTLMRVTSVRHCDCRYDTRLHKCIVHIATVLGYAVIMYFSKIYYCS